MFAEVQLSTARCVATRFIVMAFILGTQPVVASSLEPTTEAEDFAAASGVCRGRAISVEYFRRPPHAGIFTRVRIEVIESIKASFPKVITIVQRGGAIAGEGESTGLGVDFRPGDEYLLHVGRRTDGTLMVLRGSDGAAVLGSKTKLVASSASKKLARVRQLARPKVHAATLTSGEDFSEVQGFPAASSVGAATAGGLLVDGSGVPARFIAPDRGEPIGYLVDTQILPDGITQAVALQAVTNAFAAWSAQTGLTFRFDGFVNFGASPANLAVADGRIRLALHDLYNEISSDGTVGFGGRAYVFSGGFGSTGGDGGAVDGLEFHRTTRGYVILKHDAAVMQNAKFLEQVLCHEIGHALGMAHSSESANESDPLLREAIMYYRVHDDERGAVLGSYDTPVIRKVHPPEDTPPFSDDRILTMVTAPTSITGITGINEILLAANDRQTPSSSLTLLTSGPQDGSVATVKFVGNMLSVTQAAYYTDGIIDPATGGFYLRKYVRFSDGTGNFSPWVSIRIVAISRDSQGDGLPDSWSAQHFGSSSPSATALSRPGDDRDKDGLTNLQEFLTGTIPVDANSRLAVRSFDGQTIQWSASPFALYTLESSADLASWLPFGLPVVSTSTNASTRVGLLSSSLTKKFLRVRFGHASP